MGSSNKISQLNERYDKSKVKCFYYSKIGHYAHEYTKKKDNLRKHDENYYNISEKYIDSLFLICKYAQETSHDILLIFNGCSNHMTRNRSLIANLDDSVRTEVKLETNNIVNVMGKVMVNIMTKQGQKMHISYLY